MTNEQAIGIIELIAGLWPNFRPTKETTVLWASHMSDLDVERATAACHARVAAGDEWPNIGRIRAAALSHLLTDRADDETFPLVWEASRQISGGLAMMTPRRRYDWPHSKDAINEAIEIIGWRHLSYMDHEPSARSQWGGVYRQVVKRRTETTLTNPALSAPDRKELT